MITDTIKLSFASTLHYAPDYPQRCARALAASDPDALLDDKYAPRLP
jgi:hypothetical protein